MAALGGGGVAPGGVIGGADVTLLKMVCRDDGTLLKPTTPAMYIDRVWLGEEGLGEVGSGRTVLQGAVWAFTYRLCAPKGRQRHPCMGQAVQMGASDIGLRNVSSAGSYVTYRFCGSRPSGRECTGVGGLPAVQPLSDHDTFRLGGGPMGSEADYWIAAPVLGNGPGPVKHKGGRRGGAKLLLHGQA